jgi:APA family basic amino acid/polyamine antiporter
MEKVENLNEEVKLRRELGLWSVIFFVYGYVVGAGILIQTGVTAGVTGPSLWLAFLIAGIPSVISAILICYVVSAFPVSGGAWVYSSRLGSPFIGMLVVATVILNIVGGLALLALGFGVYFEIFIPGSFFIVAIIILLVFYVVNIFGIKFTGWLQILLAICGDFLVIFIFIIFGLPHIDINKLRGTGTGGLFPMGIIGIFMGAVILSFSYQGFTAVAEIGGEVKNPRKNIPLGLLISFFLIATVYILVSIVMTGNMDWRKLGEIEGNLVDVAAVFLPQSVLLFLSILILIAIASTIHGILLAYSRNLFSAARDQLLPSFLAKLNKKYSTPHWSITIFVVGAIILLFFQASIIDLSIVLAFTGSITALILATVPLKLEKKFPNLVEKSQFKLNRKILVVCVVINISYAILSLILMVLISPVAVFISVIFYIGAVIYYIIRKKWLAKKGISLIEICKKIPEETLEV